MTSPLVSITVPIYKVQKDLPRCLDSLINQTLENIEIILVDDGSPDQCGNICDEYAAKDHRIKVIHKENGGLASARQAGLELCSGIYYTVCDGDDWVEADIYEKLYNKAVAEDADIVLSNYYNDYPDGRQIASKSYSYTTQEQYIEDLMFHRAPVNTWCKLFKLSTIKERNISYEEGINLGEDALFLYKLLLFPMRIYSIDGAYYHYQRDIASGSYTNNISLSTINQNIYIANWMKEHYNGDKYHKAHVRTCIGLAFLTLRAKDITKEFFANIIKNVSITDIFRYRLFSLKSILVICTKIFGLKFGLFIFSRTYKFFYK